MVIRKTTGMIRGQITQLRAWDTTPDAELIKSAFMIFGAIFLGMAAWSGNFYSFPLALVFPALWRATPTRMDCFLVSSAYHMASAFPLLVGSAGYFGLFTTGPLLWLLSGLVMGIPWYALWRADRLRRLSMLPLILVLSATPPIGIVGWANPLTAAGVLFPGAKWMGLLLTMALIIILATSHRLAIMATILFLGFSVIMNPVAVKTKKTDGWRGIDTRFDFSLTGYDISKEMGRLLAVQSIARKTDEKIMVFPESIVQQWDDVLQVYWEELTNGKTLFIGAITKIDSKTDNLVIELSDKETRIVYRQRMPIPLVMWRPWSDHGFIANWFDHPVFNADDQKVAPLICYEALLMWPVLQSMWYEPDVLLVICNDWWTANTSIPKIQKSAVSAWARLFDTELIMAINYPSETEGRPEVH